MTEGTEKPQVVTGDVVGVRVYAGGAKSDIVATKNRIKELANIRRRMEAILKDSSKDPDVTLASKPGELADDKYNELLTLNNNRKKIVDEAVAEGDNYEIIEHYRIPDGVIVAQTPAPAVPTPLSYTYNESEVKIVPLSSQRPHIVMLNECSVDGVDDVKSVFGFDDSTDDELAQVFSRGNTPNVDDGVNNAKLLEALKGRTIEEGEEITLDNGEKLELRKNNEDNSFFLVRKRKVAGIIECGGRFRTKEIDLELEIQDETEIADDEDGSGSGSENEEEEVLDDETITPPKKRDGAEGSDGEDKGSGDVPDDGGEDEEEAGDKPRRKRKKPKIKERSTEEHSEPHDDDDDARVSDANEIEAEKEVIPTPKSSKPVELEQPNGKNINYRNIIEGCSGLNTHISDRSFSGDGDEDDEDTIIADLMNDIYGHVLSPHFISQTIPDFAWDQYKEHKTFDDFLEFIKNKEVAEGDNPSGINQKEKEKIVELYGAMRDEVADLYRICRDKYDYSAQNDEEGREIDSSEIKRLFIKSVTDLILPKAVAFDMLLTPIENKSVDTITADDNTPEKVREKIAIGIQEKLDTVIGEADLSFDKKVSLASNLIHTKIMSQTMKFFENGQNETKNGLLTTNERRTLVNKDGDEDIESQSVSKYSDGMTVEEINAKTDNAVSRLAKANKDNIPVKISEDITKRGVRAIKFERTKPIGKPSAFRLILKEPFAEKFNMITFYGNVGAEGGLIDGIKRTCDELERRGIASRDEIIDSIKFEIKGCDRPKDVEKFFRKNYSSEPSEGEATRGFPFEEYRLPGGEERVKEFLDEIATANQKKKSSLGR